MRTGRSNRGYTIIEMIVVIAMSVAVASGVAILFTRHVSFMQHMRVRQQVMFQSRQCMETIQQSLRNGKAKSLVISTPNAIPIVPNSRIDFAIKTPLSSGATSYAIYLDNRTVFVQEFRVAGVRAPKVLATNVSGLMFTGDYRDPGVVGVTLRIDAPWDKSGKSDRVSTLILPNHIVHMADAL